MKAREAFIETMSSLDPTKLVFLDESGFATNLARRYGWAPLGERPTLLVSKYGKRLTVIGAIALDGVRAWTSIQKGMNGDDFIAYLRNHLNPTLREGDVVVMDGPRVHRVAGVDEALAEVGATALYRTSSPWPGPARRPRVLRLLHQGAVHARRGHSPADQRRPPNRPRLLV